MSPRSVRVGIVGAAGLAVFYAAVVGGASGSLRHLADQVASDWYFLVPITAGFGLQLALMAELRRCHRMDPATLAAGGVGAGASTAGMVACCAHHLSDLVPFLGATGAAAFLVDHRVPFMLVGIGVNAAGVMVAGARLRRATSMHRNDHPEVAACAHVS